MNPSFVGAYSPMASRAIYVVHCVVVQGIISKLQVFSTQVSPCWSHLETDQPGAHPALVSC